MDAHKGCLGTMLILLSAVMVTAVTAVALGEQGEASADGEADAYYKYTVSFTVRDVSGYAYYVADYGDGDVFDTRSDLSSEVEVVVNDKGTKDIVFTHTYPEVEGERYTFKFSAGNSSGVTVERARDVVMMGYPTVSFVTGPGTSVGPIEVRNGAGYGGTADSGYYTPAARPGDPVSDDREFTGWYVDEGCTEEYDWSTPVTQDIVLYAGWDVPEYRVVFVSDGNVVAEAVCKGGVRYPPEPSKDGFEFTGWYMDQGCTARFDPGTVSHDMTVYAGFSPAGGDSDFPWILVAAVLVALCASTAVFVSRKGSKKRRRSQRRPLPHR